MSIPPQFIRYRSELEEELRLALSSNEYSLYSMMRYHVGWEDAQGNAKEARGGKLLRPTLCLYACEAVNGDWHLALPAAAAVELVHGFTLIHDDIEDDSPQRRHQPAVWKVWGLAHGVNAGDGMWAVAQKSLLRLRQMGVQAEKIIFASDMLSTSCLKLCEGQCLDLEFQDSFEIRVEDYLKMINGKTSRLFDCALSLGAVVGTDDQTLISQMGSFGTKMGLAFQIHDDLLGIWGDEKEIGKSSYTDIIERKKSLPIIYALSEARGTQRETLISLYSKPKISSDEVSQVVEILNSVGAQNYIKEYRKRYHQDALDALNEMNISSEAKAGFQDILTFMLK